MNTTFLASSLSWLGPRDQGPFPLSPRYGGYILFNIQHRSFEEEVGEGATGADARAGGSREGCVAAWIGLPGASARDYAVRIKGEGAQGHGVEGYGSRSKNLR